MQLSHADPIRSAAFDDPTLVSFAGLVPAVELARRAGLEQLVREHVTVPGGAGVAAGAKVSALVAGMVAGADSIADMDLLRHGGMGRLFGGVRAPSTLGTFLRAFAFGHVRQLDAVASRLLAGLSQHAPIIATPSSAPVIVATRLRKGSANSARGAARLVADAIATSRTAGVAGPMVLRADSAYYGSEVIAAARRHGVRFSITARKDRAISTAIASIGEDAWTAIHYPHAVFDEQLRQWVSDAEVAEIPFTAFASRGKARQVSARLIVRRVRDQNPTHVQRTAQGELFRVWRHHVVFTDSPLPMLKAERDHRRHAIIEQVIADLKNSALAHLPSGHFAANSAWLVLAAMAFNLTRAIGALASAFHAKAATATIRRQLIAVAARVTRSARRSTLRLPTAWPWADAWQQLFIATTGPPHRA